MIITEAKYLATKKNRQFDLHRLAVFLWENCS
jgi:hypothetical protein